MRRVRECQCGRLYAVDSRPVASGTVLLVVTMVIICASCWAWILGL